jgi:hypothetical protein
MNCELCGTPVRAILGAGNVVILCSKCIDESRSIDGTLKTAFDKVKEKRK